jgi:hypothetical protein
MEELLPEVLTLTSMWLGYASCYKKTSTQNPLRITYLKVVYLYFNFLLMAPHLGLQHYVARVKIACRTPLFH